MTRYQIIYKADPIFSVHLLKCSNTFYAVFQLLAM